MFARTSAPSEPKADDRSATSRRQAAGRALTDAHGIPSLQRSAGNAAVVQLIRPTIIAGPVADGESPEVGQEPQPEPQAFATPVADSHSPDDVEDPQVNAGPAPVQRTIGDGHDLTSPRFAGDVPLEGVFDGEQFLRFGSRGEHVRKVQQALIDFGFPLPRFGADATFMAETKNAVIQFQTAQGLTPDGIIGPLTMGALDTRGAAPGPPPTPPTPPSPPTPPAPVPVTIGTGSGNTELWWFDGQNPANYPTRQSLTGAAVGATGTFVWTIVGGAAAADFAGATTFTGPNPTIISKNPSAALNDVQVRVRFTGADGRTGAASIRMTVRAPQSMTKLGTTTTNNAPTSYLSLIRHSIEDQFATTLPRAVPINEQWDNKPPIADAAGTNWPSFPPTEGGVVVNPANWADQVGIADGTPSVLNPVISAAGGPLIQHFAGHWQVGSTSIGVGRRALNVTWQFFQGRADHSP